MSGPKCKWCNGTGKEQNEVPTDWGTTQIVHEKCGWCNGRGYDLLPKEACPKCNGRGEVFEATDDMHGVTYICGECNGSGRASGCFLTTACVAAMGLSDACHELQVLREFRAKFLSETSEGRDLILHYYEIAPGIVTQVSSHPRSQVIWRIVYKRIGRVVKAIESNHPDEALTLYQNLIIKLKNLPDT